MNKLMTVLGVAAVATLAGCKDPSYNYAPKSSQDEVKVAEPQPTKPAETPAVKKCTCLPGTKHAKPCACGAGDCLCVVETKAVAVREVPPKAETKPLAPEYTTYIVQRGDFLAKISKRFNVSISSIKRLNGLKSDMVRLGQKLKLPGKIDVGEQKAPTIDRKDAAPKKATAAYTGATKEYVVKSGDTLGAIAYGNGTTIRQLKKMNNLTADALKIGQKLKIPAEGKTVAKKAAAKKTVAKKAAEPAASAAATPVENAPAPAPATEPTPAANDAAPVTDATAAADATAPAGDATGTQPAAPAPSYTTYTVAEGDDLTGITIRFGVSAAAIRELNGLADDAQLKVGQVIKVPADTQQ